MLFLFALGSASAQGSYESVIVDAQTGEPLPFASIYSRHGKSTITNALGAFSIVCDSADVLRLSYVGYHNLEVRAADLQPVTAIKPATQQLAEVEVKGFSINEIIRKTTKETLRQMQKFRKRTATFFYRQTAFSDSTCNEYAEAFFNGRSAVELQDLQLLTGRYAAITPDAQNPYAYYRNFYTFSQISLAQKGYEPDWSTDLVPLFRHYDRYYDVDYDLVFDADDRRLIVLIFMPKPHVLRSILATNIYVDEQTLHIRRVEGYGVNTLVRTAAWEPDAADRKGPVRSQVVPTEFSFIANMTEQRGFTEVESVYANAHHEYDGHTIATHSIIFNLGESTTTKGQELEFFGNLHQTIETQGYDPQFWEANEVVRRMPMEYAVVELFERQHLFGNFKQP